MRVAIVIVNFRTADLVRNALASIPQAYSAEDELNVVLVDGFSDDGSVSRLQLLVSEPEYHDWVEVLPLPLNGGFGWATNQAILHLLQAPRPPEAVHVLNPDATLHAQAGTALLRRLRSDPSAGAIGSRLVDDEGRPASSAFRFPSIRSEFCDAAGTGILYRLLGTRPLAVVAHDAQKVHWVSGASMMFRAQALRDVGLFDDSIFLYHEEVELMWRLRRNNWTVWYEPQSVATHIGGAATGVRESSDGQKLRRPTYWYESRHLLFCSISGRLGALAATLGWLLGRGIWKIRETLGLTRVHSVIEQECRDRIGTLPIIFRKRESPTRWSETPGALPRWLP